MYTVYIHLISSFFATLKLPIHSLAYVHKAVLYCCFLYFPPPRFDAGQRRAALRKGKAGTQKRAITCRLPGSSIRGQPGCSTRQWCFSRARRAQRPNQTQPRGPPARHDARRLTDPVLASLPVARPAAAPRRCVRSPAPDCPPRR